MLRKGGDGMRNTSKNEECFFSSLSFSRDTTGKHFLSFISEKVKIFDFHRIFWELLLLLTMIMLWLK